MLINKISWNIRARKNLLVEVGIIVATEMKDWKEVVSVQVAFKNIRHSVIRKEANCEDFLEQNSGTAWNWTTFSKLLL